MLFERRTGGRSQERSAGDPCAASPQTAAYDEEIPMSNLVHNERLKLRATFLSNFGIAAFIACFVTPGFFEFAGNQN
jgi:hypothetical protein